MAQPVSRIVPILAAALAVSIVSLLPVPAQAWWHGGFFIGGPVIAAPFPYYPPAYYAPPAYYPPYYPPAYYAPPAAYTPVPPASASQANLPNGSTCYAGFYVCQAPASTKVGSTCSCPGLGAPSYGTVN